MFRRRKFKLRLPSRTLLLGQRTLVMGVLNVTPDSFSDGGLFLDTDAAVARALEIERAGADILDIGGESTRPGSKGVSAKEELQRILPVLEKLRGKIKTPISVDTSKSEVAEAAAAAGAEILNDVTALRNDPRIAEVARRRKLPIILMHMRGEPAHHAKRPIRKRCNPRRPHRPTPCNRASPPRRCSKISNHHRPRHRLRQKLRAKSRTAPPPARTLQAWLPALSRHIQKKFHRPHTAHPISTSLRRRRPHLGHRRNCRRQHPARRSHSPRA